MAEKKPAPDPFAGQTAHRATRELEGDTITVGDLRAMFGGTRIPNNARVTFDRGGASIGVRIVAEWATR